MFKVNRIALIPQVPGLNPQTVMQVAAAIQKQVMFDFAPEWHLSASVGVQPGPTEGVVPVYIVGDDLRGLAGFHMLQNDVPYAVVRYGPTWSVATSHEILEMIADPTGDRTALGSWTGGPCNFVVEVCDPCQLVHYPCDGILVSDFCLPAYYDQAPPPGTRLSWCKTIPKPKHVLPGGTLAWITQNSQLMQVVVNMAGQAQISTLGPYAPGVLGARAQLSMMDQTYTRLSHLKLSREQRAALRAAQREVAASQRAMAKLFNDELQRRLQAQDSQSTQGGSDAKASNGSDVHPRARRVRRAQGSV
jgi:hypothetical protein